MKPSPSASTNPDPSQTGTAASRALFDALPDMLFRFSADGTFLEYRPGTHLVAAIPAEGFLGKRVQDVFPHIAQVLMERIRAALQSESLQVFEYELPGLDGPHEFEARIVPCGPDEVLAVVREVNETKRLARELKSRADRMSRHVRVLSELARYEAPEGDDLACAVGHFGEASSRTLGVARVSVWMYGDSRSAIHCVDLFDLSSGQHSSGAELLAEDYPAYFAALDEARVIAAHDACADARTREFTEAYLSPLGITSMLDSPIRAAGKVVGIVCHEHIGPARHWSLEEEQFASSVADLVALTIESRERDQAQRAMRRAYEEIEARVLSRTAELEGAYEALRRSEARYQELVENANDIIYTHDLDLNVTSINSAALRITGYTRDEGVSMKITDVIAPESIDIVLSMFRQKMSLEEGTTYEIELMTKGGRRVPVEVSSRLIKERGQSVGIQGIARDITDRRRAQAELAEQSRLAAFGSDVGMALTRSATLEVALEECAEAMVKHLGASVAHVWTVDPDGALLDLRARAGAAAVGPFPGVRLPVGKFRVGRVAKERRFSFIDLNSEPPSPDDGSWATRAGLRTFAGYPLVVRDRTVGVMSIFSTSLFSAFTLNAMASVADEIALGIDRALAADALARSEERYRRLFDDAPIGIYRTTPDGQILNVNAALVRMLGFDSMDELTNSTFATGERAQSYSRDEFKAWLERDGEIRGLEAEWRRRDGTIIAVNENAKAIRAENGRILYFEGTVEDITERKRAEDLMRMARDAAVESARLKSQFLANTSHEIRTPLNGILGMTFLLRETELSAQQREYVETVRASGDALLRIVNEILDLAKIEAGAVALDAADFELSRFVDEVTGSFAGQVRTRGLVLSASVAADAPVVVRGDPMRLRQVLANLVGNAVKFTPSGEVRVSVGVASREGATATLRFEVSDSGIGIPQGAHAKLFEPFVQVDGSMTREYGGTGLGLTICRQLVELMGGRIGVESEPDHGSVFWFLVPFLEISSAATGRPVESDGLRTESRARRALHQSAAFPHEGASDARAAEAVRVLVVEDNEVNQAVARGMLETLDCQVDVAANGLKAIAALSRVQYDIVFMDCQMPIMDGFEATEAIRAREGGRRTPIVALTASAMQGDRERCLDAGMDDYITKPFTVEDFRGAIQLWARPE